MALLESVDFGSRGSFWADFAIFKILGEAGDINNSTSMTNYCNGPYIPLLLCANKVSSAWSQVWTIPWTSKASIFAPGGRDLGDS